MSIGDQVVLLLNPLFLSFPLEIRLLFDSRPLIFTYILRLLSLFLLSLDMPIVTSLLLGNELLGIGTFCIRLC
jgi:hypothetical protein